MKEVFTPLSLWKDVDYSVPFDVQIVSEKKIDEITLQKLYFTGRNVGEQKSRVYALIAYKQLPAPCVIHIGKIDRAMDTDFVMYWASCGYCCIRLDYGGDLGQGAHSIYPEELDYANFNSAGNKLSYVDETARQTPWYEYGLNTKRAIQYLFEHNMVCEDKIAVASYGELASTVAVHLLATEKRLKTGIIMFGSIWDDNREISGLANIVEHDINQKVKQMEEEERYFSAICKQSYLQYVTQPIFLVCSANTWGTSLDKNYSAMSRIPNRKSKALFIPDYVDRAPAELFDNIHHWFDIIFDEKPLPKRPRIKISSTKNGVVVATDAKKAEIHFSRKHKDRFVYWETAKAIVSDNLIKAKLTAYDNTQSIAVYATVEKDGLVMSSGISIIDLAEYPAITRIKPDRLLYAANVKEVEFVPLIVNETESYSPQSVVEKRAGLYNLPAVYGKSFGTFALWEYPFNTSDDSYLSFDAYSAKPQQITVKLVSDWSKENRVIFSRTVNLLGGNIWQKVKCPLRDFKCGNVVLFDNTVMPHLEVLCFECEEEIFVNNLLFG